MVVPLFRVTGHWAPKFVMMGFAHFLVQATHGGRKEGRKEWFTNYKGPKKANMCRAQEEIEHAKKPAGNGGESEIKQERTLFKGLRKRHVFCSFG